MLIFFYIYGMLQNTEQLDQYLQYVICATMYHIYVLF